MKQAKHLFFALLIFFQIIPCSMQAQIYNITVIQRSGKTIIGWVNPNPDIRQLVIQRSKDSVQGFRSIATMPDPTAYTNGYVDKPADSAVYYYRLFGAYPGGRYFFTESKKPATDPSQQVQQISVQAPVTTSPKNEIAPLQKESTPLKKESIPEKKQPNVPPSSNTVKINSNTTIVTTQPVKTDTSAKSIIATTTSTLAVPSHERNIERIRPIPTAFVKIEGIKKMEKPFIADSSILNLYEPSGFIYANKEGNLVMVLPEPARKHFNLKVSREDGTIVFVMRNIKESELLIDRSNFFHSGWFNYELSENGKIRERNKFFIPAQIK